MCLSLRFRRKSSVEDSDLDPRFGSQNITSPVEGAYTDPANPTKTRFVASPQIPEVISPTTSPQQTPATSPKSARFDHRANRMSTGSGAGPNSPTTPSSPNPSLITQMKKKVGRLSTNLSANSSATKGLEVERTPASASSATEQWPGRM